MAPQPHNLKYTQSHWLKVGDRCWLVVGGDDKDGANCHEADVIAVDSAKNEVTVRRPAWTDDLDDTGPQFDEREVSGLSHLEGVFSTKKVIDGEGNGKACLCQKDENFKDGGYNDMVEMRRLNDAELAYNLKIRAVEKVPYCRCGVTLVAINLYEPPASYAEGGRNYHIYSPETLQHYVNQKSLGGRNAVQPHPWSLASSCYTDVFNRTSAGQNNQAIVITGESGAGKTFTTQKMLDFLAHVGKDPDTPPGEEKITDMMLAATPILEGFGNANMPRNPDSSRFGKLYKIFFDENKQVVTGCTVTPYMLEKSRMCSQQMNERNFHIFYRMLAPQVQAPAGKLEKIKQQAILEGDMMGFTAAEKARYHMPDFEHFTYLKGGTGSLGLDYTRIYGDVPKAESAHSGFVALDGLTPYPEPRIYKDAQNMSETKFALAKFFTEEQIDVIWRVTAGCLWIGNIEFTRDDDDAPKVDTSGASGEALDKVAELWMIDKKKLEDACHIETVSIGQTLKPCPRNRVKSLALRDSLTRSVYNGIFVWMIEEMSKVLSTKTGTCNPERQPFIGVLDIFGFEFYPDEALIPLGGQVMNTLDQYNINMCNEVLQGEFVRCIFDLEQDLYQSQLGKPIEIDFEDNKDTIELMKARKHSIITELDGVIAKNKSGLVADHDFMSGLERMAKDKRFPIKSANGKSTAAYRMNLKDGKGRKQFHNGGPYGYDPKLKSVPRELGKETPGFFQLQHYAANVTYDVRDWVDKDLDKLSSDSYECIYSTQLPCFMTEYFRKKQNDAAKGATVARDFANSLDELVTTLRHCSCNFVRCLKASNPLTCNVFKNSLVLNQLKYTGMLDTLIIRRGGFPIRMEFQDFVDQYRVIEPFKADEGAAALAEFAKTQVPEILSRLDEKPTKSQWDDAIRVGAPKRAGETPLILMRDWLGRELDTHANMIKERSAVITQAVIRMGMQRHGYAQLRNIILAAQNEARLIVAGSILARAEDRSLCRSNLDATLEFAKANESLLIAEAAERKDMYQEDLYAEEIYNVRLGEKLSQKKATALESAEKFYKQAIEQVKRVHRLIDTVSATAAEIDAGWAKWQSEGVVKRVPLIREYKARSPQSEALNPPPPEAYTFRYDLRTQKSTRHQVTQEQM